MQLPGARSQHRPSCSEICPATPGWRHFPLALISGSPVPQAQLVLFEACTHGPEAASSGNARVAERLISVVPSSLGVTVPHCLCPSAGQPFRAFCPVSCDERLGAVLVIPPELRTRVWNWGFDPRPVRPPCVWAAPLPATGHSDRAGHSRLAPACGLKAEADSCGALTSASFPAFADSTGW